MVFLHKVQAFTEAVTALFILNTALKQASDHLLRNNVTKVSADCEINHNADLDLCGTVYMCANRLQSYGTLTPIELL